MENLRNKAKELLESQTVQVVVGYENGSSNRTRAAFVREASQVNRLIFDERCTQNLAVYITKHEVKHFGKIAMVATVPVMRTILMLISEYQLKEENIVVLGISEDGKLLDFPTLDAVENYLSQVTIDHPAKEKQVLAELRQKTIAERWLFWQEELSKCIKCYACRASCPLCYCNRCAVECNQPQWISVPSNNLGNVEWHTLRAMHLAGRCTSCGQCAKACPLDIPCDLLTMHLADISYENFGVKSGLNRKQSSVLSSFKPEDKESFIR